MTGWSRPLRNRHALGRTALAFNTKKNFFYRKENNSRDTRKTFSVEKLANRRSGTTRNKAVESQRVLCATSRSFFREGRPPSSCLCTLQRYPRGVTPKPPRKASGRR